VRLLDLNLLSYYYLLSRENLTACAARIARRMGELEQNRDLPAAEAGEYRLLAENFLSQDYLLANTPRALAALKETTTYASRASYLQVATIIRRAMEFISAAHYPVRWYPRGFSMSHLPTQSGDVLRASEDDRENIFIPFFESCLPQVSQINPAVIGISINYYCQLIPGLTLARLLKKRLRDSFLVVGGGLICFFAGGWEALRPFSGMVDGFIPFEGELPLLELLTTWRRGGDLAQVKGFVHFREEDSHYLPPPPPPPPALEALPCPDFDGLPLADYLSPQVILPGLICRGCYWGRCAFCSHAQLYRGRFRQKAISQVLAELQEMARKYGTSYFYFTDEAIPPPAARRLSQEIRVQGLPYQWFGEMRLESALDREALAALAQGGCRMLMFGLESAAPRVLDLMHKGIIPEKAGEIIQACREQGIRTFVMFFIGFPTETRAEAEKTLAFIAAHHEAISHVAFTNFILEKSSPIYQQPSPYGLTTLPPNPGEDLKIYAHYEVEEGLSGDEAISFLEEIKDRPMLRALIETYLVSRAHLIFLPPREKPKALPRPPTPPGLEVISASHPKLADGLVPLTLLFNLDVIRTQVQGAVPDAKEPTRIKRMPTNYLFHPSQEKLVEVGDHGLLLLKPCNGRFSLGEILGALGEQNRPAALDFYQQLAAAGFLVWEEN